MGVILIFFDTSTSAVVERPQDASCLSVVSFNSTIHRAQSSVVSYFHFRFIAAYTNKLFYSPVFNVVIHVGCDKHRFTDVWRYVRMQLLFTLQQSSTDIQLFVENRNLSLPHLHSMRRLGGTHQNIVITFGMGKTRMVWLPNGKKFWRCVYSFRQNVRIWQTDRRTPHDGTGCT